MSTNYRILKFLPVVQVVQVAQGVELLSVEVAEGQKAGHDQEEVQETEAVWHLQVKSEVEDSLGEIQ